MSDPRWGDESRADQWLHCEEDSCPYLVTLVTSTRADGLTIRECHNVTIPGTNVITNNVITTDKISRAIKPARGAQGEGHEILMQELKNQENHSITLPYRGKGG